MEAKVARTLLACAVALGLGVLIGKGMGPAPVAFPEPDQGLGAEELEQAVSKALSEPRAFVRATTLARLYEGLTIENAAGAARAVSERAGRSDPVDLQIFLGAWALVDPLAAIQEVRRWPVLSRRSTGVATVIREWAAGGGKLAAADYVQTIEDPDTRRIAEGPLVRGWALAGDHQGALELARTLWGQSERPDLIDPLARAILDTEGPSALFDFVRRADSHGVDRFHQRLVRVALNLGGREDPKSAAALYDEVSAGQTPEWLAGALDRVAGDWRNADPQAVLEWLLPKPESMERAGALTETIGTWVIRDYDAAWRWLLARGLEPEGSEALDATDSALLAGLLRRTARVRPEEASRWVTRLRQEDPTRLELIRRIANFWSMQDSAAAARWIGSLPLSPAERAAVEQSAEWGRRAGRDRLDDGKAPGESPH